VAAAFHPFLDRFMVVVFNVARRRSLLYYAFCIDMVGYRVSDRNRESSPGRYDDILVLTVGIHRRAWLGV